MSYSSIDPDLRFLEKLRSNTSDTIIMHYIIF